MKSKRISQIEEYINEHKTVSIDELCDKFAVSKNTIRRDIDFLVGNTNIKKIYGGVTVPNESVNRLNTFQQRHVVNSADKLKIAQAAANFIEDGDTIFVDSGTTTTHLAKLLSDKNVTVITGNLDFINNAIPYQNINIITLPGDFYRETLSFVGTYGAEFLQRFNIKKCFMATTGFSEKRGVTNSSPLESSIKKSAIKNSDKVFLLVDMSKYEQTAMITYCELNEIDCMVTTGNIPSDLKQYCNEQNITLINL